MQSLPPAVTNTLTTAACLWHSAKVNVSWQTFSKSRVLGENPRGKYTYFMEWKYLNFLKHSGIG